MSKPNIPKRPDSKDSNLRKPEIPKRPDFIGTTSIVDVSLYDNNSSNLAQKLSQSEDRRENEMNLMEDSKDFVLLENKPKLPPKPNASIKPLTALKPKFPPKPFLPSKPSPPIPRKSPHLLKKQLNHNLLSQESTTAEKKEEEIQWLEKPLIPKIIVEENPNYTMTKSG